jgi:hypothetical protein
MLGREVVKASSLSRSSVTLATALGGFRAVGGLERQATSTATVFGAPDLRRGLLRARVRGLGQRTQHVGDLLVRAGAVPQRPARFRRVDVRTNTTPEARQASAAHVQGYPCHVN